MVSLDFLICFFAHAKTLQGKVHCRSGSCRNAIILHSGQGHFSTPRFISWESAVSVTLTSPTGDIILVGKYFCHTVMTEAEQWCLPI